MVKKTIKRPLRPGSDEVEEVEVEVENGDEAAAPVEGEIPSQLVPYPTGNPWVPPPLEPLPGQPAPEAAGEEPAKKGKK
jgi:hypothetical protein